MQTDANILLLVKGSQLIDKVYKQYETYCSDIIKDNLCQINMYICVCVKNGIKHPYTSSVSTWNSLYNRWNICMYIIAVKPVYCTISQCLHIIMQPIFVSFYVSVHIILAVWKGFRTGSP